MIPVNCPDCGAPGYDEPGEPCFGVCLECYEKRLENLHEEFITTGMKGDELCERLVALGIPAEAVAGAFLVALERMQEMLERRN